jgi:hypothetical protein
MLTPYVRVSTEVHTKMCGELLAFVGRSHSGQKSWKKSNRKLALRLLALSFPLARAGLLLSLNDQQSSVAPVLLSLMKVSFLGSFSPWSFPE